MIELFSECHRIGISTLAEYEVPLVSDIVAFSILEKNKASACAEA